MQTVPAGHWICSSPPPWIVSSRQPMSGIARVGSEPRGPSSPGRSRPEPLARSAVKPRGAARRGPIICGGRGRARLMGPL
eukprot:8050478-Pyramimonas_sp.AAC.2